MPGNLWGTFRGRSLLPDAIPGALFRLGHIISASTSGGSSAVLRPGIGKATMSRSRSRFWWGYRACAHSWQVAQVTPRRKVRGQVTTTWPAGVCWVGGASSGTLITTGATCQRSSSSASVRLSATRLMVKPCALAAAISSALANLGVEVGEGVAALAPVGADQVCQGVGVQLATELVTRQVTYQSDQ